MQVFQKSPKYHYHPNCNPHDRLFCEGCSTMVSLGVEVVLPNCLRAELGMLMVGSAVVLILQVGASELENMHGKR